MCTLTFVCEIEHENLISSPYQLASHKQHFSCNKITTSIFCCSPVYLLDDFGYYMWHILHVKSGFADLVIIFFIFCVLWCGCCDHCGCNKRVVQRVIMIFSQYSHNSIPILENYEAFGLIWLIDLSSPQMQEQFVPTFPASLIPEVGRNSVY